MDIRTLLKNLIIGFIPLIIFIAADEFFCARYGDARGTRYALITAIFIGILQALFIYIKEKRLDKMVLLDTGLILALGGVSLFSGNDLFFKLKPALVEFIMVIILGIVAFFNPRLLLLMTGRFMQGMEVQDHQLQMMRRSAAGLFAIFFLHTALIVYSAFALSKESWAFISGGLFYILAGTYFVSIFISGRMKRKKMMRRYYGGKTVELTEALIRRRPFEKRSQR